MDTRPTPEEAHRRVVSQGRAMVQIIEAAHILLETSGGRFETWLLKAVRGLYQHRLRESIAMLPPEVTAEILAASQKILGPMNDISAN